MWLCRPAALHPREGQPALWEFPWDHRREGWSRHHHRQLWSLPAYSQLRLWLHHQRQRSGRREPRLRRKPRDLRRRRMGPHDHQHQQWHRSSRLQYGPGRSDTMMQKGYFLSPEWQQSSGDQYTWANQIRWRCSWALTQDFLLFSSDSSEVVWLSRLFTENLSLLPQTHEVSKCTYAQPVGDSWILLHFRGVYVLCYIKFFVLVYWQYLPLPLAM